MIIDSHVHIGLFTGSERTVNMTEENVLEAMLKYNIDYAMVSNLECCPFDADLKYIKKEFNITQSEANLRAIAFAKANKEKIGIIYTMEPYEGKCDEEFEKIYLDNKDYIYALKFHPYHSNLPIDDDRCTPYLEFAVKYNLPVTVHTASDDNSHIKHLINVAKKYPNVNFQAVHMGLGTDNNEAIKAVEQYSNIYGDTTWVQPSKIKEAIEVCGEGKIIFGTDTPIDGVDTYANKDVCSVYLNSFKELISDNAYRKLMSDNAIRFFGLICKYIY